MAALGSLSVNVVANVKKFTTDMKKARLATTTFAKKIRSVAGSVAKFGSAMAATSLAAGSFLLKQQIDLADAAGKTAQKLGTTTEELSKLRFAAKLTGVEANTLDMALQRVVRRISEAAQGSGEAVKALQELGLDAKRLAATPLAQQLALIADRMQELPTQADRVRIAMRLFDSEGVALVNTLGGGSEGLRRMAEQAAQVGAVIRGDTAKAAAEFNDELLKMQTQLAAAFRDFFREWAPTFMKWMKQLKIELEAVMILLTRFREMWARGVSDYGLPNVAPGTAGGSFMRGAMGGSSGDAAAQAMTAKNTARIVQLLSRSGTTDQVLAAGLTQ